MKASAWRLGYLLRSLKVRLIAFLTIALLPLGAIAVLQTMEVIRESDRLAERDVLARTERAATEQEAVLQRAFGASTALGTAATELLADIDLCSTIMADFVQTQADFVFAGFVAADGVMACNSAGIILDYAGRPDWEAFVANPMPDVTVNRNGDASRQSVYITFTPIFDDDTGELLGGQAVSIPHSLSQTLFANADDSLDLGLVNADGELLAASTGMDDVEVFDRLNMTPNNMYIPQKGLLLEPASELTGNRAVAIVPLIAGRIYVVGLWAPEDRNGVTPGELGRTIPAFPLLMWLASLAVAYITVNKLILSPLALMSRQMDRYKSDKPHRAFVILPASAPSEIADIAGRYNRLLDRVAADTAKLEDNVAEKETLLREVHHRVKNNLQLISSILNMQMRGVDNPAARHILSRVQDRVLSLSSIHKALYTDDQLKTVRADLLMEEIVDGLSDLATSSNRRVDFQCDLDPVCLDPDQAVPLSLLATEAITNAVKYVGAPKDARPRIEIALTDDDEEGVTLTVRNTRVPSGDPESELAGKGTGLGARLIKSFASQLSGDLEITETDTHYNLRVQFRKTSLD